ncbi:MAG: hypothetical protein ACRYFX_15720 [Janthinobacterium lividum]
MLLALAQEQSGYAVATALDLHAQTVYCLHAILPYLRAGWQAAVEEHLRSGRFDRAQRAALTALACTPAPTGHSRWVLRLLADKTVELELVDAISRETVGQVLKKTNCGPTASSTGAWAR